MNLKKKLVSILAATSMLASLITAVPVSAYEVSSDFDLPAGVSYYSNTNSDGQSYIPGENYILEASTAYKTSGNYSLHLAAPNEYSNVQLRIGLALNDELSASKTYRVTGKAVRISDYGINAWWDCVNLCYGTSLESYNTVGTIVCSDDYSSKGFADFSFDITPSSAANLLVLYTWQGNYYVDDMSCKLVNEDGTLGEELMVNGGFETIAMPEATAYPKGVYYWSNGYVPGTNYTIQAESTTGYVKSGKYALNFNTSSGEISNVQIAIKIPMKKNLTVGKTYKVSYDMSRWARSSSWWSNFKLQFEGATSGSQIVDTTLTNLSDCGWISKSFDVTMECDAKDIQFYTWSGDYSVDNLSVVEKYDDGTYGTYNYVYNGGFELVDVEQYTELENVVAYSAVAANTATVSWTNPDIAISDAVIKVDGEAVEATIDEAASAFNQVVLENLTEGTHEIEVSAVINGVTKTYTDTVTADAERGWVTSGIDTLTSDVWATILSDGSLREGNTGYANTKVSLENEDDNSYVKLTGNIPTAVGNTYAGLQYHAEELEHYYQYKLVFKAKGENVDSLYLMLEPATEGLEFAHIGNVANYIEDEWNTYEVMLTSYWNEDSEDYYDMNIQLICQTGFAGWFAIDDVELYACESNGTIEGDNLIENGTFDYVEPVVVMADPVLSLNDETKTNLVTGTMNVAVNVENVDDIALIIALYKDGALKTVSPMEKTTDGSSQLYETGLIVPDLSDGVYTAKIMYWETLTGLKPLRGAFEITE